MIALNPDRWREVTPYLDHALSLAADERERWLASIAGDRPQLAELLQELLDEHRSAVAERFLEAGPLLAGRDESLAGQRVGVYTLVSLLGDGGMGAVWLAERNDGRFERRVAVKFLRLPLARGSAADRFTREGNILGRLTHPHIAELVDAGVTAGGQPFLVLEHVEGEPIDQHCDRQMLGVDARIRLFLDVLAAVAHAHANLIVHRDIKPSNVMVTREGSVKLLDFGIAKLLADADAPAATQLTVEGGIALTPQFAAPEQITGGTITTATDVYTLGALLYLLLAGRHPAGPASKSTAELIKAIVDTEPQDVSDAIRAADNDVAALRATTPAKLQQRLRGDVDTIVATALKKRPAERYGSVAAFADDLQRWLDDRPINARPDSRTYRATKFVRRHRVAVALTTLSAVAILAGVIGTLFQARSARRQRDFAFRQLARAEQMNSLNRLLLTEAAPTEKPLTIDALLEQAEHIVEHENYADHPDTHVELLVAIGTQYFDKNQNAPALRLLDEAYRLSRGSNDPSARAQASCALAPALVRDGQHARAESLIREALEQLPADPQLTLDRVFCLLRASDVDVSSGAAQAGIEHALAAQRALGASSFQSDSLKLDVLTRLGNAYSLAGQYPQAVAAFEQAADQTTRLGYGETRRAAALLTDWAFSLALPGRQVEAEKVFRRAIDLTRRAHLEDESTPSLLTNYAGTLMDLGRLGEAAEAAEQAVAQAQKLDDRVGVEQAMIQLARVYRIQGNLSGAGNLLAQVEPMLRRELPAGHYAFASVDFERALIAEARHNNPDALRLLNEALAITVAAVKSGGQGAHLLPTVLERRSSLEIAEGQLDQAVDDARRAAAAREASRQPGSFSSLLGQTYVTLGRALGARGDAAGAARAFRSGAEQLAGALGADNPRSVEARRLAESAR